MLSGCRWTALVTGHWSAHFLVLQAGSWLGQQGGEGMQLRQAGEGWRLPSFQVLMGALGSPHPAATVLHHLFHWEAVSSFECEMFRSSLFLVLILREIKYI